MSSAKIIIKFTTDDEKLNKLVHNKLLILNNYLFVADLSAYVEDIENGLIFFTEDLADLRKFFRGLPSMKDFLKTYANLDETNPFFKRTSPIKIHISIEKIPTRLNKEKLIKQLNSMLQDLKKETSFDIEYDSLFKFNVVFNNGKIIEELLKWGLEKMENMLIKKTLSNKNQ